MTFVRLLFIAVVVAPNAACTTSMVNAGREDAAHPLREFGDFPRPLVGEVVGTVSVENRSYARVVLPAARQTCGRDAPLELLLPVSADGSGLLREHEPMPRADGKPLLVYGPRHSGGRPPIEERAKIADWLRAQHAIVIEHHERMGLKASYRLGDAEPQTSTLEVQSDWACRSHVKHALMMALYLPAAAVDVITLPIQIVLFLLTAH